MESPMKYEPSAVPIITSVEEVELEDKSAVLVKRRRIEFSGSIVQAQQCIEVDMAHKVPDDLPVEVSTADDPMDVLTGCAMQSSGGANGCSKGCAMQSSGDVNGCSKGHAHSTSFRGYTGNEPARLRLSKLCTAMGWKEPSFDFEERGPAHNKLFICKVTLHFEGLVNTVLECFGDPKPKKKAALDHAVQGALWCLERFQRAN